METKIMIITIIELAILFSIVGFCIGYIKASEELYAEYLED